MLDLAPLGDALFFQLRIPMIPVACSNLIPAIIPI
jgi:hypothetical protein